MRQFSILLSTTVSILAASLSASAALTTRGASPATGTGATFVTAPFTAGPQTLFSATIVNVNAASLNSLSTLSGNNAGSAPQGGIGARQGGLGFANNSNSSSSTFAHGIGRGASTSASSNSNNNNSGSSSSNTTSTTNTTAVGGNTTSGLSSSGQTSLNINNGSSSVGQSSANVSNGLSSAGYSSANNTSGSSSVGQNSANDPSNGTSNQLTANLTTQTLSALNSLSTNGGPTTPVLLLSSLINSTTPRFGSAGAVFQGLQGTQINTVSFQYGSLPTAVGQASATGAVTPVLVVDDQSNGFVNTRFIPATSGTVSNATNGVGLTTVSFNAQQLQIQGQVQRIGVAIYQQGEVIINNVQVNGSASSGILAQGSQSFPF